MPVMQTIIERPGLRRTLALRQFADPLAFLTVENAFLEEVLARLDRLARRCEGPGADLAVRRASAGGVLDYFRIDLPLYVDDENALLDRVERCDVPLALVDDIADEMRDEHAMLWRLLEPVADGLEEIAAVGNALEPERFSIAVLVLSTFLRLHCGQTRASLIPLAEATLDAGDMQTLGREMAFRRGLGSC